MPGGTGRWGRRRRGRTCSLPRSLHHPQPPLHLPPYLPNPAPEASPVPRGSSQRPPEPRTRAPHGRAAAAGGEDQCGGSERGLSRPRSPKTLPTPRPAEPPLTCGKVNGTCWSRYPFILPPVRYLRGAAGSRRAPEGGGRGTAGVKLTTSRASRTCRGQPTPGGGNPIPGGRLLTAPQT